MSHASSWCAINFMLDDGKLVKMWCCQVEVGATNRGQI